MLSGTEVMHTSLTLLSTLNSHNSLFSSLSGPQAAPFNQHHHRFTSADTSAPTFAANFERASLIPFTCHEEVLSEQPISLSSCTFSLSLSQRKFWGNLPLIHISYC